MAKKTVEPEVVEQDEEQSATPSSVDALAAAFLQAINASKGPEKKNSFNRKVGTPWTPKDGSPKLKLTRKIYQHGLPVDEEIISNKTIKLLNELQPGLYCDGFVKVHKRRDFGIEISYQVKTAAHRMKLPSQYGIRSFDELIERCNEEHSKRKVAQPEFEED